MKLNDANTEHLKKGFTLLELLTVMAIMVIMMSIAGASYYGMSRGAAIRGSASNLTTSLSLARQFAVNHRNRTHVKLWQDITNANYEVFIEAGRQKGSDTQKLELNNPKFGTGDLVGGTIYNLTRNYNGYIESSAIVTNQYGIWVTQIIATNKNGTVLSWSLGDKAAWSIKDTMSLMPGIEYAGGVPRTVIFNTDGTADKDLTMVIQEVRGTAKRTVYVKALSGKIWSE